MVDLKKLSQLWDICSQEDGDREGVRYCSCNHHDAVDVQMDVSQRVHGDISCAHRTWTVCPLVLTLGQHWATRLGHCVSTAMRMLGNKFHIVLPSARM